MNSEFDNITCTPPQSAGASAAELTAAAQFTTGHAVAGSMHVTIDGLAVAGLADASTAYRSLSPFFSFRLPTHNVGAIACSGDLPRGTRPPAPGAISDGIYIMAAPLGRGTHTIRVTGAIVATADDNPPTPAGPTAFTQDINYRITVG